MFIIFLIHLDSRHKYDSCSSLSASSPNTRQPSFKERPHTDVDSHTAKRTLSLVLMRHLCCFQIGEITPALHCLMFHPVRHHNSTTFFLVPRNTRRAREMTTFASAGIGDPAHRIKMHSSQFRSGYTEGEVKAVPVA